MNEIPWLLNGEPREAQLEALSRSMYGQKNRDHWQQEIEPQQLPGYNGSPYRGWGHFMQMRVGKTPTTLNEIALLLKYNYIKRAMIVAPNKFKFDWEKESESFGLKLPVHVFESNKRAKAEEFVKNKNVGMLVVNYEAAGYDNTAALMDEWNKECYLACDESIMVKNHKAGWAKNIKVIADSSNFVRMLSGKPIVQDPSDIWMQLRIMGYLDGTNYYAFRGHFCDIKTIRGTRIQKVIGGKNEEELNRRLNRVSFVAPRRNWMHSPEPDYMVRKVNMTDKQKELYTQMQKELVIEIESGTITADQVTTKLLKLQQITSGFVYDEFKTPHTLVHPDNNPKLQEIMGMLENEIDGKVIVAAYYKPSMALLEDYLTKYSPALIRRGMTGEEVLENKNRFNNDPNCRVMIGQMKSIKYGHTLMGSEHHPCLHTIFFENSYNLDDRSQVEERNQGKDIIGSPTIIDFVASSIESQTIAALQAKESISEAVLQMKKWATQ